MPDPPAEKLDDQIAKLEAAVSEILVCASCGKALDPNKAECPHCKAIVGEKIELAKKSVGALVEVPRPAEPSKEPPLEAVPAPSPLVEPPKPPAEPAPGVELAAKVEPVPAPVPESKQEEKAEPAPELKPEPTPKPVVEVAAPPAVESVLEPESKPEPSEEPEVVPKEEAEAEAEVRGEAPVEEETKAAPAAQVPRAPPPRIEVVSRGIGQPPSFRRPAVIATGMALYLVGIVAIMPLLGKYVGVVVMVLASVIVAGGILLQSPQALRRAPRVARGDVEYVCPLCGTEVAPGAKECGTCGAQFET